MHQMADKLAKSRGLKQEHYAAIQSRLQDDIERLQAELIVNRTNYKSCVICNRVFYSTLLIKGQCIKCASDSGTGQ